MLTKTLFHAVGAVRVRKRKYSNDRSAKPMFINLEARGCESNMLLAKESRKGSHKVRGKSEQLLL